MYKNNIDQYINQVNIYRKKMYINGNCKKCTLKLLPITEYFRFIKAPKIAAENNCVYCLEVLFKKTLNMYSQNLCKEKTLELISSDFQPAIIESAKYGSYECLIFLLNHIKIHPQMMKEIKYFIDRNKNIKCIELINCIEVY